MLPTRRVHVAICITRGRYEYVAVSSTFINLCTPTKPSYHPFSRLSSACDNKISLIHYNIGCLDTHGSLHNRYRRGWLSKSCAGYHANPFAYIGDAKSTPADAQTLFTEITSLCQVLDQLVKSPRKDSNANLEHKSALCVVIKDCRKQIEGLHRRLEKLRSDDKLMGVVERIKWPFKKDEYRNTVEKLQRFVKTFAFALKIENLYVTRYPDSMA